MKETEKTWKPEYTWQRGREYNIERRHERDKIRRDEKTKDLKEAMYEKVIKKI